MRREEPESSNLVEAWQRFWFEPRLPHTLAVIRIATGAMIAYVHVVWALRLKDFMGSDAWIDLETIRQLHGQEYAWSYLWYVDSLWFLWLHQALAIAVGLLLSIGLFTRIAAPLAWFMTLMVCHRMTGMLFGLDQVVMMLSMYLMIGPCGAVYSLDAWWRDRNIQTINLSKNETSSSLTAIATRLMQIHLCVMYLFGGLGKMRGEMWWDGSAMWFSVASYEYQSMDMTWIGRFPMLAASLTHITLFWETFYAALVWPRWSRPFVLGIAFAVHAGIGAFLGMVTFGFMMIIANLAFIEPETTRRICQAVRRWRAPAS